MSLPFRQQRGIERCGTFAGTHNPRISRSRLCEMLRDQCFHFRLLHPGRDHRNAIGDDPSYPVTGRCAEHAQVRARGELSKYIQISGANTV